MANRKKTPAQIASAQRLGKRLKKVREENGIKQTTVAIALNITQAAVVKWEKGGASPSVFQLEQMIETGVFTVDQLRTILGVDGDQRASDKAVVDFVANEVDFTTGYNNVFLANPSYTTPRVLKAIEKALSRLHTAGITQHPGIKHQISLREQVIKRVEAQGERARKLAQRTYGKKGR